MFALVVVLTLPSSNFPLLLFIWNYGISLSFQLSLTFSLVVSCNSIFTPRGLMYA